jgi:hypothetical protein
MTNSIIPRAPFAVRDISQQPTHEVQAITATGVLRNVTVADNMASSLVNRERTWVSRIFPNEMDRMQKAAELKMCETELEALQKALYLVRTAANAALEESVNAVLLKGKGRVREDTLECLTKQLKDLTADLNHTGDEFAASISRRWKSAQEIEYEHARAMVTIQCEEQVVLFKEFVDKALVQFKGIIDEQVRVPTNS